MKNLINLFNKWEVNHKNMPHYLSQYSEIQCKETLLIVDQILDYSQILDYKDIIDVENWTWWKVRLLARLNTIKVTKSTQLYLLF